MPEREILPWSDPRNWGKQKKEKVGVFSPIFQSSLGTIFPFSGVGPGGGFQKGLERHLDAVRQKLPRDSFAAQLPRNYPHRGVNF